MSPNFRVAILSEVMPMIYIIMTLKRCICNRGYVNCQSIRPPTHKETVAIDPYTLLSGKKLIL